jgi:hypothetical protein
MQRTDAQLGGSWSSACGALRLARFFGASARFWINLQGRYDRLRSRPLGGLTWGSSVRVGPRRTPEVRARNRGEGWVMAARKAREGYELRPR